MKKIYYFLAFIAVASAFGACNPLDKTYKELGPVPAPKATAASVTITLAAADYALLPATNYAKTSFSFKTQDDAKTGIPVILNSKYPTYGEKSSATVTYGSAVPTIQPADSLFKDVAYTLVNPTDYTLIPGNTFIDFSAAQIITWLGLKYPNAVPNQLAVLTFIYYESGSTATVTQSFLYLNNVWQKLYTISAAQYTSIGKGGTSNDFSSSDAPLLQNYLNAFLKADPAIMATAKFGDIKYVSYKYFVTSANTFQRVMALEFDGTNWVNTSVPATLAFAKTNGTWVADNTVTYSLVAADYTTIANIPNASANAQAIDNLKQHGNFSLSGATAWADAEINAGIVVVLKAKYPTAVKDQKFVITYSAYNGATISVTKTFVYDGTTFAIAK